MVKSLVRVASFCAITFFLTGITITLDQHAASIASAIKVGYSETQATTRGEVRRVARRTARRVNRRHDHYRSLPTGCTKVIFNGVLHYYCGGIYYLPQVDRNETVYVIVTP